MAEQNPLRAPRLDERLAQQAGLSRSRVTALIREGRVRCNGVPIGKGGLRTRPSDVIEIINPPRYVSRGGEKLEAALYTFGLEVHGFRVLDLGISTGGFTDCVLQAGAASVVGVDVGHGQLAAPLQADPRVTLFEGINARDLKHNLPCLALGQFDLITVDLSFISVNYIIPGLLPFLVPRGLVVVLLKPQFEVGRERLGANGIVRDQALHGEVLNALEKTVPEFGFRLAAQLESPIRGSEGNREFLVLLERLGSD